MSCMIEIALATRLFKYSQMETGRGAIWKKMKKGLAVATIVLG